MAKIKQGIIIKTAKNKKAKYKLTKTTIYKTNRTANRTIKTKKRYAYISRKRGSNGKYKYKYS